MTDIPSPIGKLSRFFKSYGIGLSLIVAALPICISVLDLVPMFAATKYTTSIITSTSSFLVVGFMFFIRHRLAPTFFPGTIVGNKRVAYPDELIKTKSLHKIPIVFIILFVITFVLFDATVSMSVNEVVYNNAIEISAEGTPKVFIRDKIEAESKSGIMQARLQYIGLNKIVRVAYEVSFSDDGKRKTLRYFVHLPDEETVKAVLKNTPSTSVPYQEVMICEFLLMFTLATLSFLLMGLKEYAQSELGITEKELILNPIISTTREKFTTETLPTVYGILEYSRHTLDVEPIFYGPYCISHDLEPKPKEFDTDGKITKWVHEKKGSEGKTEIEECHLQLKVTYPVLMHELEVAKQKKLSKAFPATEQRMH